MAMTTMVGMSTVPPQLRRRLASTRAGRRYQRLLHAYAPQVEFLVTVYPDVREHVGTALERLLAAAEAGPLDEGTLVATSRVLDDLDRFGDVELRGLVGLLRDELELARGQTLDQILADR